MKNLILVACVLALATLANAQQLNVPALSPTCSVEQAFSQTSIKLDYSRPSMRGRTIFGGLVPWDQVWRTGANAATKVTFGEDVMIGGKTVPAGSYSLYTVPKRGDWEVIINKNTGNWGTNGYSTDDDVVRFEVEPTPLGNDVETMTLMVNNITFNSCTIDLMWERTHISIPVKAENDANIVKEIESKVENPRIPYRPAALYYYNTNQKLDKALEYVTLALKENPKAYWNELLRGQIAAKLGKKDVAKDAVAKARDLTKGTPAEESYAKMTEEVINSLSK